MPILLALAARVVEAETKIRQRLRTFLKDQFGAYRDPKIAESV